jgi:hypothetical protein
MKNITTISFALGLLLISSVSSATACKKQLKLNILKDVKVFQCEDETISHAQPENGKYEGLCGATAGANAFHAYCKSTIVDPTLIAPKYFWDVTPGIRPDILKKGMNRLFKNNSECIKGEWKYYYSTHRWGFLDSLYYEVRRGNGSLKRIISKGVNAVRSPVIVLTKTSGLNLHWVTVVDIIGYKPSQGHNTDYKKPECKVIFNDDKSQTTQTCAEFVARANGVDDAWYTDVILPEYVHLVFEPIK